MSGIAVIGVFAFQIACCAAWVAHIIHTVTREEWILFAIGTFIPPIGSIHGFGIWLGLS
jgi:hypothetical protein